MAIVSVTRLRVRSWRYLPVFLFHTLRINRQIQRAKGNVSASVLRDADRTFWTTTVWTTESAMKEFMVSGPHGHAMRGLLEWCDEAALVHWEQEKENKPDWGEAYRRLQTEGRRSKVNHPSVAHQSYQIRPPSLS